MSYLDPTPPAFDGEACAESLARAECARADKRIAFLDEIAELVMELARKQQRKALEQLDAAPEPADGAVRERDAAAGFLASARAVRVTLLVQAKLQAGVNVRRAEMGAEHKQRKFAEGVQSAQERSEKTDEIADIVADVIETEACDRLDVDRLAERGREAVQNDWYDEDYCDMAVGAVVAKVCKDLGVEVDWSRWEDEDWAIEEAEDGAEGSPFAKRQAPGEPNGSVKPPDGAGMGGHLPGATDSS